MRKMNINGKEMEVSSVDVILANENWNEYTLANGDVLRIKDILTDVGKVVNQETTLDNQPVYVVKTTRIITLKDRM